MQGIIPNIGDRALVISSRVYQARVISARVFQGEGHSASLLVLPSPVAFEYV